MLQHLPYKGSTMVRQVPKPVKNDTLLTPAQVAAMFGVDVKTVSRWAKLGKLPFIRTLGGHRRYSKIKVDALLKRP